MVGGISLGKGLCVMSTSQALVSKRLERFTLSFAHILNRTLNKNVPAFFPKMRDSFFISIVLQVLKEFCRKIVKSKLFEKYFSPLLATYQCKQIIQTAILLLQEFIKYEKLLVYDPTLTLIFRMFGVHGIGKLYILRKIGLSIFKEILYKYVYGSTFLFLNIFLFYLKKNPENLSSILWTPPV